MRREVTRRGVLAAAVSLPLLATGCKGIGGLGTPPPPSPDVAVVRDAIARETLMISGYDAVLAAVPALAGPLRPLLQQHREHLARLRARLIGPGAGGRAGDSPSDPASPSPGHVPRTAAAARAYLRRAEQAAAQTLMGKLTAVPPSLAQLLASIAASEATHALLLGPGRAALVSASASPPAIGTAGQAARQVAGRAAAVSALQVALTAEHAAVYGYGAAGAHLAGARQKAAARDWADHQAARDTLAAMVTALGARPVAAATAYRLPFPVRGGQAAVTLAAYLEDRVAAAYLGLVALSDARLRVFGAQALRSAALRAAGWRGRALAFPGLEVPPPGPVPSGPSASQPAPVPSTPGGASPSPPPTGPVGG